MLFSSKTKLNFVSNAVKINPYIFTQKCIKFIKDDNIVCSLTILGHGLDSCGRIQWNCAKSKLKVKLG